MLNGIASKFKAKPFRTNHNRGFTISKKDVRKIAEQYRVVDEIIVEQWNNEKTNGKGEKNISNPEKSMDKGNRELVTDVADVTGLKSAYSPFDDIDVNGGETSNGLDEQQVKPDTHDTKEDDSLINTEDHNDNDDNKTNVPIDSSATDDNSETNSNNDRFGSALTSTIPGKDDTTPSDIQPTIKIPEKDSVNHDKNGIELKNNVNNNAHTPSESVTSVTSVTDLPAYPCLFCSDYKTHIDFDMELHLHERHKGQLLKLPMRGNLDKREEHVISLTKKKMVENSNEDLVDEEEE